MADTNNHSIRKINLTTNSIETINVTVQVTKEETYDDVDYIESIGYLSLDSNTEWHLKFMCPSNCKWSEGAPHKWKIILSDSNLKFRETAGKVCDGEVLIHVCSPTSNFQIATVKIQADLYLCANDSGTCTQKTVLVQLNFDERMPPANHVNQYEFLVKT